MDEFNVEKEDMDDRFIGAVKDVREEHGTEIGKINDTLKTVDVENFDIQNGVSLDLAADITGVVLDRADEINQLKTLTGHDITEVVEVQMLETAQALVDARAVLSSADSNEINEAREQLDMLVPVVEADFDQVHEQIEEDHAVDAEVIKALQDANEAAQVHAELNPGISAEHAPYELDGDHDVRNEIDDKMGVVDT